ncbi:MAG: Fic family protein [Thermoanaerobaculia bacterium]
MNPEGFSAPEAGRVVRSPGGYFAFVPAPLPPAIRYDDELVLALSRADSSLSELSGLGRLLPNPHLLIAPYVRKEAVLSSKIEGTTTDLSELLQDEAGAELPARDPDDVREVRNYVRALEYGVTRLKKLPLSLRLVRELHERLMRSVRGDQATPGAFRRSQNWIGAYGSTPDTASYVPPPVEELQACLDAWEKFLHQRDRIPDLVQCALMHEQFEAIHPFLDGNGRIGRLLITLFLIERNRLSQPLLYLSAYIERNRTAYYELLQRVRTRGDWRSWILYFLRGVAEISNEAVERSGRLMELREKLRNKVAGKRNAVRLLEQLFENPYVTVAGAVKLLGVSNPTARQAVKHLQAAGVLSETTGREWGRLYLARPILKILEMNETNEKTAR